MSDWSSDVCAADLFGRTGVTLAATAVIDATASGYAAVDSRDAKGGDVTIATDGTGILTLAAAALIDVSAKRPGERLVRLARDQGVYYQYTEGDQGGTVTLRAPIVEQPGADKRSEEHTSELQSLMRISYAVFCSKKKTIRQNTT